MSAHSGLSMTNFAAALDDAPGLSFPQKATKWAETSHADVE